MTPKSTIGALALLLPPLCLAADYRSTHGADIVIEGYSAQHGGTDQGSGAHSLALIHAGFEPTSASSDALNWTGYISAMSLNGRGPTERFAGDFQALSNIEGYDSVRLYSWWLEANKGAWSLRAGALLADEEFTGTDGGGNFANSSFGWPAFISANTVNTGPAFFVAAPGLRLARSFGENSTWLIGIYDGDTFDSPTGDARTTRHGVHYQLGGHQGWFIITEATRTLAQSATRLTLGAWVHTADFDDVRDDDNDQPYAISGLDPKRHHSNYGAYAAIQQTLAGKSGKPGNVEVYVRGGLAPSDRNALGWTIDTGLAWTGLISTRPNDITALGLAHAYFSPRFAANALMAAPASPAPDYESVIELSYSAALTKHLNLQPDFQLIRHPGGSTALSTASVFLLRLNASF